MCMIIIIINSSIGIFLFDIVEDGYRQTELPFRQPLWQESHHHHRPASQKKSTSTKRPFRWSGQTECNITLLILPLGFSPKNQLLCSVAWSMLFQSMRMAQGMELICFHCCVSVQNFLSYISCSERWQNGIWLVQQQLIFNARMLHVFVLCFLHLFIFHFHFGSMVDDILVG